IFFYNLLIYRCPAAQIKLKHCRPPFHYRVICYIRIILYSTVISYHNIFRLKTIYGKSSLCYDERKKEKKRMEKLFFVQIGTGVDLHGQDITKAAIRAVENAIHYNSMPGLRSVLPENRLDNMKVNIKLAVPC